MRFAPHNPCGNTLPRSRLNIRKSLPSKSKCRLEGRLHEQVRDLGVVP